ncbi:unnamed protein product [Rhizophagus irregularis]|nr:unnamed protein product [Rhizophagus irregularis]
MSSNTEFNSNEWIDWIEEAIAKKHIKYYDYKHFNNIQEIGFGNFGKVYRANWKSFCNHLALKSFFNFNNATVKEIVNEINLQRKIDFHENIIRFCGITTAANQDNNSKKYLLVMEYANSGLREKPIPNTPVDYIKIYTDCWNNEPDNRPTVNQVIAKLNEIISKENVQLSSEQKSNDKKK